MAIEKRALENSSDSKGLESGIYLAKVVSHLDPSFMGSLEVTLLRRQGNSIGDDNQTYVVRYASPFYGSTAFEFMGTNKADFNDTQKSYGMWFVPPDIGVTVMVVFVDGDPAQGYWLACVPGRFTNHMVPGIASTTDVELTSDDAKKYNPSTRLPTGEINRRANDGSQNTDVDKLKKPVHPIAEKLLEAGLLDDDARGTHNSSARRDIPSMVFGISTPGPVDRRDSGKKQIVGTRLSKSPVAVPVSRLGGTQIVMDDGDDQYRRLKPAGGEDAGPVEYVDTLDPNETRKGQPDIPYGESFRIRTRTGHQILLHNSEDLIYIGNSRGTTWIELTSNGKIDIYAQDSVSIHTENDLNIRAERDINLEAERNINLKAVTGRVRQECATDWEVLVGNDGKITIGNNFDLNTASANKFTAGGATDIKSGGNHTESAAQIHMNGPAAATAETITALETHANPTTSTSAGWNNRYQDSIVESIMKRIPMHEPWTLHENQAPTLLTPDNTDREV